MELVGQTRSEMGILGVHTPARPNVKLLFTNLLQNFIYILLFTLFVVLDLPELPVPIRACANINRLATSKILLR